MAEVAYATSAIPYVGRHPELGTLSPLSRRDAIRVIVAAGAAALAGSCRSAPNADTKLAPAGRLVARPSPPTSKPVLGKSSLGLATGRDGLLYVPASYEAAVPAPLVLMLHGAGQSAEIGIRPFLPLADAAGAILVAPDSRGSTWDFLYGPYGADVAFIDRALTHAFERCAVDPARIVIEGFSDGASYALSLGLTNGDFFSRIVAFSPCILAPAARVGRPKIFISHGTNDRILPIDNCGRRLAAQLGSTGYEVEFHEFTGPHMVPPDMARAAMQWMGM
jgi:phospholipase/carboxylesterase